MTVREMCQLGQVSRAGFYRFDSEREPWDEDLDLRDEIQRIALEFPCYGRPRITAELKRRGWKWATDGSAESCEKIICFASGGENSWWRRPIPVTTFVCTPTSPGA